MFVSKPTNFLFPKLLVAAALLSLASCKKDDDPNPTPNTPQPPTPAGCAAYTTVQVTEPISTATTWHGCTVYVVNTDVRVSAPLTIEAGAIVKFGTDAELVVTNGGLLTGTGTADRPVVFTSLRDDARGGDSNADGATTTPAAGNWGSVYFDSEGDGSRFTYCEFRYGGSGTSRNYTLYLSDISSTVDHCLFVDNKGGAPQYSGVVDASRVAAGTVVKNSTFYRNGMPLAVNINFGLDDSNTFHDPANATVKNTYQGIWADDDNSGGTTADWTWAETEVPFVSNGFGWNGGKWTLGAGVTMKFRDQGGIQLSSGATILAQGTAAAPVTFTSYKDDAVGGDTNADGTTTQPAKANWQSINLNAVSGSSFDYCRFLYGGHGTTASATLKSGGAAVFTVKHSTFAHNGFDASVTTSAALDAYTGGNGSVIQDNVFYDNFRPLSISAAMDLDDSNTFHNPANASEKNKYQGIVISWDNNIVPSTLSWTETEAAFVLLNDLDLATGKTLTLASGVTLKFTMDREMMFRDSDSQLLNHTGAIFTSIKDDASGGDSNGDGAATSPAVNDWEGVSTDDVPRVWHQWATIHFDSH